MTNQKVTQSPAVYESVFLRALSSAREGPSGEGFREQVYRRLRGHRSTAPSTRHSRSDGVLLYTSIPASSRISVSGFYFFYFYFLLCVWLLHFRSYSFSFPPTPQAPNTHTHTHTLSLSLSLSLRLPQPQINSGRMSCEICTQVHEEGRSY